MANSPKRWVVDYAESQRSKCMTCNETIDKDLLRIGRRFSAPHFDGFMLTWNHAECFLKKRGQFQAVHEVEGFDELRWKDKQKIIKYVGGLGQGFMPGSGGSYTNDSSNEYAIENAKSSRAICKSCNEQIVKEEVRISTMPKADRPRIRPAWRHAKCFLGTSLWTSPIEKMPGWDSLTDEDKASVQGIAKPNIQKSKEEEHRRKGKSRKRKSDEREPLSGKKRNTRFGNLDSNLGEGSSPETGELELKLKKQTDALWRIKDDLKKHVKTAELRKMLQANDQDQSGSESKLMARCADGMYFGALGKCPICGGGLECFDGRYMCLGHISAWSKCTFSTTNPERLKGKWKTPQKGFEWFKSQKEKKPLRLFGPQPSKNLDTKGQSQNSETAFLKGLAVALFGNKKFCVELKKKLKAAGGTVLTTVTQDAKFLVINESEIDKYKSQIENAVRMEVPVFGESILVGCLEKKNRLQVERFISCDGQNCQKEEDCLHSALGDYKNEKIDKDVKLALENVKRRVRDSVHVSSGLQATGHIFEEGKSFYSITLNMCDLSSNINSYYILQVIKDDKEDVYYVFRKWDRVGNDQAIRQKLEKKSKSAAIDQFRKLFLEHTGNKWENWVVDKDNFEKKPDKFFPLNLDYRVDEPQEMDIGRWRAKSKLDPRVLDLMNILFDPKTYRDAMKEYHIRMPIMPLGKLSERHIIKGFEALKRVEDIIELNEPNVRLKESKLVDASSRFSTLIPTVRPFVIRDKKDLKSKVHMLENLQDMEIASKLMHFEINDDDPFYANYKKLNCNISPLPHNSFDYQIIERYLKKTHAPTHNWELELEDAYSIDREGEHDAYILRKSNLKNCMLLWHGSRVTNFLGILSRGLRIAPPEAPSTGYMFGKGIYLADLGSKGSKYCRANQDNSMGFMGFMLLTEVALGEVYEIKKAEFMEEPPKGKDSTKGVGIYKYSTEYELWRDDVIVPCGGLDLKSGRPSKVKKDHLKYNEYIVYKTDQVKLQFLLKVRFHYK